MNKTRKKKKKNNAKIFFLTYYKFVDTRNCESVWHRFNICFFKKKKKNLSHIFIIDTIFIVYHFLTLLYYLKKIEGLSDNLIVMKFFIVLHVCDLNLNFHFLIIY